MYKFSIISVLKDCEKDIEISFKSLNKQTHQNIEHVTVVGNSSDKTILEAQKYCKYGTVFKQNSVGLYEAINQGILCSNGDIVGLLHGGDYYPKNNILEKVHEIFINTKADVVYGDIYFYNIEKDNQIKITRKWESDKFYPGSYLKGWAPPHTSLFIKRSILDKVGLYSNKYKISGDYDFLLKLMKFDNINFEYLNEDILAMKNYGMSTKKYYFFKKIYEDYVALRNNNIKIFPTILLKRISKLKQFQANFKR